MTIGSAPRSGRSRTTTPGAKECGHELTTVTNVSVDGVTQGHRRIDVATRREADAPEAGNSGGFERFGWGPPLLDDEASTFISQAFQRVDAFLLGRRTYEIFAGSWGVGNLKAVCMLTGTSTCCLSAPAGHEFRLADRSSSGRARSVLGR